jgi:hypothetical protein
MKSILPFILFLSFSLGFAQDKRPQKMEIVEVSCGQCQFGMQAKGCDLAIRIKGKSYFVDGTKIDEHGDAHAKGGFCSAIRKAEVIGEKKDNRFVVSYFNLLPIQE